LDEYHYELQNVTQLKRPSQTDFNDPLYKRKYAQSMPPLEAYKMKSMNYDKVNVAGDNNRRAYFYGWNNITDYEREAIHTIKEWIW